MLKHFDSAEDYYNDMVDNHLYHLIDKLPELFPILKEYIEKKYMAYINGQIEIYHITQNEFDYIWRKATEENVIKILTSLSEKEMVQPFINANGDIVYGLTEKGKEYCEKNYKGKDGIN